MLSTVKETWFEFNTITFKGSASTNMLDTYQLCSSLLSQFVTAHENGKNKGMLVETDSQKFQSEIKIITSLTESTEAGCKSLWR